MEAGKGIPKAYMDNDNKDWRRHALGRLISCIRSPVHEAEIAPNFWYPLDIAPIDGEGGVRRVVGAGLEIHWNDGTRSKYVRLERHASPVGVEMLHWDNALKTTTVDDFHR